MNDYPLVSIGVPTYNRPELLERTIKSLLNQTYPNIEVIVSDNATPGNSVERVIEKYNTDERLKFFKQSANIGPSGNFNFVLAKSTGDFLMRIGDDDFVDANYISECVDFLIKNEEYAGACGENYRCDSNGNIVGEDSKISFDQDTYRARLVQYFTHVYKNSTYFSVVRKNQYENFISQNLFADDWLIVSRILFSGKIRLMSTTHSYITEGGISHTFEGIIKEFGLNQEEIASPWAAAARNVFDDIASNSNAYSKLSNKERIKLAALCRDQIEYRFGLKHRKENYILKKVKKIRTKLKGLFSIEQR